jgi:hypothetical protein
MRRLAVVVFAVLFAACGGSEGTKVTGPSSTIPNVAGNYSGNTTVSLPELGQSVTCPTSTSVTQSGSTISIAPLVLSGSCGNMSLPMGQRTIDATGGFGQTTATYNDTCGTYNLVGSGGFFDREMRLSVNATSSTCYNFNLTVSLSR